MKFTVVLMCLNLLLLGGSGFMLGTCKTSKCLIFISYVPCCQAAAKSLQSCSFSRSRWCQFPITLILSFLTGPVLNNEVWAEVILAWVARCPSPSAVGLRKVLFLLPRPQNEKRLGAGQRGNIANKTGWRINLCCYKVLRCKGCLLLQQNLERAD